MSESQRYPVRSERMNPPDIQRTEIVEEATPVQAWRVWGISGDSHLMSISAPEYGESTLWQPRQSMHAEDLPYKKGGPSQPGFHAYRIRRDAIKILQANRVMGRVELWGKVQHYVDGEGAACLKATRARPASLVACKVQPGILEELARRYTIPVEHS